MNYVCLQYGLRARCLEKKKGYTISENKIHLHHFQFFRISQITWSWVVTCDISLDVNVSPVDQPLLNVLQHLLHHGIKGTQLGSYKTEHGVSLADSKTATNLCVWFKVAKQLWFALKLQNVNITHQESKDYAKM